MNNTALNRERELAFARFSLKRGELISAPDSWIGHTIQPSSGKLWITQPGDPSDYFVCESNSFLVAKHGTVVQALRDAEFKVG